MNVFVDVVIVACLVGLLVCAVMLWRNEQVYRYRRVLINQIHDAQMADLEAGRDPGHARWDWFESVTYDEMANRPWRPLDSFYGPMP